MWILWVLTCLPAQFYLREPQHDHCTIPFPEKNLPMTPHYLSFNLRSHQSDVSLGTKFQIKVFLFLRQILWHMMSMSVQSELCCNINVSSCLALQSLSLVQVFTSYLKCLWTFLRTVLVVWMYSQNLVHTPIIAFFTACDVSIYMYISTNVR